MGKVVFNMSMSLDGFVAGLNDSPDNGLGDNGDRLFKWYFNGNTDVPISDGNMVLKVSAQSAKILNDRLSTFGADVWGRKTFDITRGWGGHPPNKPCFIVTHSVLQEWVKPGSPFIFVTDGIESAIRQAKQAAGEKDVGVCTANILQQCLSANLMDEIRIDLVPVLLGDGVRLFEHIGIRPIDLECVQVIEAPGVTHLTFRVIK
jgi:dihydrofolate reductase